VRRASDYIGTAFPTLHWVDCQRDNNNHNNNYNDNSQLQQHLQALKYRPIPRSASPSWQRAWTCSRPACRRC